jgi:hypothetical protein
MEKIHNGLLEKIISDRRLLNNALYPKRNGTAYLCSFLILLLKNMPHTISHWNSGWFFGWSKKKTPWSESASELHRPSHRRLSAKWLSTLADRGCHVVSVTDPYGRILDFLGRSRSSGVLTRLSGPRSRPTTFSSGSAGNRTRTSGSVVKNSDN